MLCRAWGAQRGCSAALAQQNANHILLLPRGALCDATCLCITQLIHKSHLFLHCLHCKASLLFRLQRL